MCLPMFSPVINVDEIVYDESLMGHNYILEKNNIKDDGTRSIILPEWDWRNKTITQESYSMAFYSRKNMDWIYNGNLFTMTNSQFKEIDLLANKLMPDWEALYQMFLKTDNILKTQIVDNNPMWAFEQFERLIKNIFMILNTNMINSNFNDFIIDLYDIMKIPENRIEIWR